MKQLCMALSCQSQAHSADVVSPFPERSSTFEAWSFLVLEVFIACNVSTCRHLGTLVPGPSRTRQHTNFAFLQPQSWCYVGAGIPPYHKYYLFQSYPVLSLSFAVTGSSRHCHQPWPISSRIKEAAATPARFLSRTSATQCAIAKMRNAVNVTNVQRHGCTTSSQPITESLASPSLRNALVVHRSTTDRAHSRPPRTPRLPRASFCLASPMAKRSMS